MPTNSNAHMNSYTDPNIDNAHRKMLAQARMHVRAQAHIHTEAHMNTHEHPNTQAHTYRCLHENCHISVPTEWLCVSNPYGKFVGL